MRIINYNHRIANVDEWETFWDANVDAIVDALIERADCDPSDPQDEIEYEVHRLAFDLACNNSLWLGGGSAPLTRVGFVD